MDLFAGCGGLSLGLEEAGFSPIYVNELNKDALSTYLFNRKENKHIQNKIFHSRNILELTDVSGNLQKLQRSRLKSVIAIRNASPKDILDELDSEQINKKEKDLFEKNFEKNICGIESLKNKIFELQKQHLFPKLRNLLSDVAFNLDRYITGTDIHYEDESTYLEKFNGKGSWRCSHLKYMKSF